MKTKSKSKSYKRQSKKKVPRNILASVKKAINIVGEKKYLDLQRQYNVSTVGQIASFCNPLPVGNSAVTRIGNCIMVSSIQARGTIILADTTNIVRLIVYQWQSDANGVTPDPSDVIADTNYAGNEGFIGNYAFEKVGTFKVLKDKVWVLDSASRTTVHFKFKIKNIKQNQLTYDNVNNRPNRGEIFALWLTDSILTTHPFINYNTRMYFTDM